MSDREEFEKAYTNAFIGEELKGLESIIFARFEISGEYAQDKVATAYAMWQARVPEGYVVVHVDKLMDCLYQISDRSYIDDNVSEIKAMLEAVEK